MLDFFLQQAIRSYLQSGLIPLCFIFQLFWFRAKLAFTLDLFLGHGPPRIVTKRPVYSWSFSTLPHENLKYYWPWYELWELSLYTSLVIILSLEVVFAWPCGFSPQTGTDWYSVKDSRGSLCGFLEFFLSMAPSSHIFCPTELPWTPQIHIFVSSTQQDSWGPFAFYPLAMKFRKACQW